MSFPIFRGNVPSNVNKDAKYVVRRGEDGSVISLTYSSEDDERWYVSTEEHSELAEMVNEVKTAVSGSPNGSFYINEYHQVIVPAVGSDEYYYAGEYHKPLKFEFEGKILSGEPVDLEGNPISAGDYWVGPHPGIPYVLQAGGKDIYYKFSPRPNVEKKVLLSKIIGPIESQKIAKNVLSIKGFEGGRFYVNEFGCMFAPVQEGFVTKYKYIGKIDFERWFPKPEIEETD